VIQPGVKEEQEEYEGTEGMRDTGLKSVIMATRLAPADEAAWEGPASRVALDPRRTRRPLSYRLLVLWHMAYWGQVAVAWSPGGGLQLTSALAVWGSARLNPNVTKHR
jgi:hypothetical protein